MNSQPLPDIVREFERISPDVVTQAARFQAAILADVAGRRGTLHGRIKALDPSMTIAGPALTVEVRPGDNLMIHAAMALAKPGDVIVVDGKGDQTCALMGAIMMNQCKASGIAGVILDAAVRDSEEIREMEFPVFSVGTNPNGPTKFVPGRINHPICVGGIAISPGDLIVADADGVVVLERDKAAAMLPLAAKKQADETARIEAIRRAKGGVRPAWLDAALARCGCVEGRRDAMRTVATSARSLVALLVAVVAVEPGFLRLRRIPTSRCGSSCPTRRAARSTSSRARSRRSFPSRPDSRSSSRTSPAHRARSARSRSSAPPADGYTLLALDNTFSLLPFVFKKLPWEGDLPLVPIAVSAYTPVLLLVNSDSKYKDLASLIAFAKANPDKLTYGTGGNGSAPHFSAEAFQQAAGVKLSHIPYKGAGEAVTGLVGGQIDLVLLSTGSVASQLKAGKLRALAASGSKRLASFPNVPTFAEAGPSGVRHRELVRTRGAAGNA